MKIAPLRGDLFQACSGSEQAETILHAPFRHESIPIEASTACLVRILISSAAFLGDCIGSVWLLLCGTYVAAFPLHIRPLLINRPYLQIKHHATESS